jgi:hypothetical protein
LIPPPASFCSLALGKAKGHAHPQSLTACFSAPPCDRATTVGSLLHHPFLAFPLAEPWHRFVRSQSDLSQKPCPVEGRRTTHESQLLDLEPEFTRLRFGSERLLARDLSLSLFARFSDGRKLRPYNRFHHATVIQIIAVGAVCAAAGSASPGTVLQHRHKWWVPALMTLSCHSSMNIVPNLI